MRHAEYVGRVGTLAVALGIGFAVATAPGVAWADTGDTGAENANAPADADAGSTSSTSGTEHDAAPLTDIQAGGTSTAAHPGIASVLAHAFGLPMATGQRGHRLGHPAHTLPQSANGIHDVETTPTGISAAPPTPSTNGTTQTNDPPAVVPAAVGSAIANRITRIITPTHALLGPVPDIPPGVAGSPSTTRPPALADTSVARVTVPDAAPARPVVTAPVTLPAPTAASLLTALPAAFINVASSLLNAVLSPLALPGGPTAPVDPPLPWAVLAFVRRQFVNTTPTLNPTPTHTDPVTGLVSGNLGGADADGDAITYSLVADGAHGAITIDQTTGDYVYTPRAGYSGTDTFIVSVTDAGPDGLFGFLRPGRGHTSAASLTITIDPSVTVTVDPVTNPNGAAEVTGRVATAGPVPHGYTLSTPPGRGQVVVSNDGSFTYIPNPVDRVRANTTATLDDDVDAFTVTTTNGINPPTTIVVTVPLSPTASAQAYRNSPDQTLIGGVVLDPTTHIGYQTIEIPSSTGTYSTHVVIIAPNGSGTTFSVTGQRPAGGVVVDPTTHIAYQTTFVHNADATYTTQVTAITPSSITTVATLPGQPVGGVVLDPTTHTAYQLTQSRDAVGTPTTVVTAITSAGTSTVATLSGDPGGRMILDPTTHTGYVTTEVFDPSTGTYTGTQVTAISPTGTTTIADLRGEHSVGEVVLDSTTHTVYQTTEFQNPATGAYGAHVTAITSDGITTVAILRGRVDGGAVVDPATGTVYQTSFGQNADGSYTTQVTPIFSTGNTATVADLPGAPIGPLVLDPTSRTAYQTTQFQNTVTGAKGSYVTAITPDGTTTIAATLRGLPAGGVVLDPVTGTVYQTTVGTDSAQVTAIATSGTTVTPVPGIPVGGVVIDPTTGTAYQTTSSGVYVVGAAPLIARIAV
jgi:hypothetical protein